MKKNTLETEYKHYLDVAKGIGMIVIMFCHSFIPTKLIDYFGTPIVPLYFIVSGCLYNNEKWSRLGFKKLFINKFKSYMIPYYVLLAVNLVFLFCFQAYFSLNLAVKSLPRYIVAGFFCYSASCYNMINTTPLWFLTCIFVSYLYFYFVMKVKKKYLQYIICALMMALAYVLKLFHINFIPWHIDTALYGCAFMLVGYDLNKYAFKFFSWLIPLITFPIGAVCVYTNINTYKYITYNDYLGGNTDYFLGYNNVDLNSNRVNNIFLYFFGAVFIGYTIIYICKFFIKSNKFLELLSRNSIIILGFQLSINKLVDLFYSKVIFKTVYQGQGALERMIIVFPVLILMCIAFDKFKNRKNKSLPTKI